MKISNLAFPHEHGAWAFFLEACLAGLLVAASPQAGWVFAAAFPLFLSYQPLKFLFLQRLNAQWDEDSRKAAAIAVFYFFISAAAFARVSDRLPALLFYFGLGLFLALLQFYFLAAKKGRSVPGEILGAVTLSLPAALLPAASGWPADQSLLIWGILALRIIPSIFYVRAVMRRNRGHASSLTSVYAVYFSCGGVLMWLAHEQQTGWTTPAVYAVIFLYVVIKLRSPHKVEPKTLGWEQVAGGIFYILSLVTRA